jgi:hypothetical protein
MSTITAILEPDADGTFHLPLPAEFRRGKVKVTVTPATLDESGESRRATPEMVRQLKEALARLRELNPFREVAYPVAWQREIRQDRPLPGRDGAILPFS